MVVKRHKMDVIAAVKSFLVLLIDSCELPCTITTALLHTFEKWFFLSFVEPVTVPFYPSILNYRFLLK
jgi:hypothetical protein